MTSLVVVLLLLACSVQLSSSRKVPVNSLQELYGVASNSSDCTNSYWRRLRFTSGIIFVVRSACRKDENTFRETMKNIECSDMTTAVSRYCSSKYIRFRPFNLVCRFARKVNERCEESDGRSPSCKIYEHYCKSSRLRYYVRYICQLTEPFYTQCCVNVPMTEPTTTPEPTTATTEAPTTEPTTTEPTTTEPTTTQADTTTSESSLPEEAANGLFTACQQRCIRNDRVGVLCTAGTLGDECNNLQPPATDGSYTCCSG